MAEDVDSSTLNDRRGKGGCFQGLTPEDSQRTLCGEVIKNPKIDEATFTKIKEVKIR